MGQSEATNGSTSGMRSLELKTVQGGLLCRSVGCHSLSSFVSRFKLLTFGLGKGEGGMGSDSTDIGKGQCG